jgi:hypothetical protein
MRGTRINRGLCALGRAGAQAARRLNPNSPTASSAAQGTAASPNSKPTSASGSASGTRTRSRSCGPRRPTRSWKPSPPTVNSLMTRTLAPNDQHQSGVRGHRFGVAGVVRRDHRRSCHGPGPGGSARWALCASVRDETWSTTFRLVLACAPRRTMAGLGGGPLPELWAADPRHAQKLPLEHLCGFVRW